MKRKIKLLFDNHISYGSKEHFFHFLWGYLLPSISIIFEKKRQNEHDDVVYCFETCGPIMDKVITEVINLLSINAIVLPQEQLTLIHDSELVHRWDLYLLRDYLLGIDNEPCSHIEDFKNCTYLKCFLQASKFEEQFKTQILQVKSIFLKYIYTDKKNKESILENRPTLVINRSGMPAYYCKDGLAETKGYGKSRRELRDVNNFVKNCERKGLFIKAYEPGRHSLVHQIITFQNASGIIGIKGAEFANLIWLKQGAMVTLIRPANMRTPSVQRKLAEILNLDFTEIISEGDNYPSILNINLNTYMK